MIIQIAQLRNELPLIKELLPLWTKYADGFIFLLDTNTDDTLEYLKEVKEHYNILEVLTYTESVNAVKMETKDLIKNVNLKVLYEKEIIINLAV